ncbi:MAG: CHASE domain-containing protein, partial [Candidatus Thiodiazotropha sp. 6PLUC10]
MEFTIREKVFVGHRKLVIWLMVILVSLIAISYSVSREMRSAKKEFTANAWQVQRAVIQRVANLETVLTALVGQHHASDMLSSAEQTLFSQELLKAYPFIHSIMHVERVSINEVDEFEERMKLEGYIGFKLSQSDSEVTANEINHIGFHLPVSFIEPMEPRSAYLLGFDLANEASFTQLLERAIRGGDTIALETLQETHLNKPLYLILKP